MKIYKNSILWNDSISLCKDSSIFHTYEWGELMQTLPNIEFSAIEIIHGCFVLLYKQLNNFYTSLIGYGGPCVLDSVVISYGDIIAKLQNEIGFKISRTNLGINCYEDKLNIKNKYEINTRLTQIIDLQSTYSIFLKSINGKARTGLKYANKNNVVIKEVSIEAFGELYKLYFDFSSKINSEYILPINFFKRLKQYIASNSLIIGAYIDEILVGFNIFVFDTKSFYYLISVQNDLGRKMQVNYALVNEGIKLAINLGIKQFDFGYSHNEKIKKFKELWGSNIKNTYFLNVDFKEN
ncbi:MAG: hypothetical protein FWF57_10370 [Defluviitaleaceae bacterium]|nr:hypothetical protein [Defluviitaleaceae bacterium]